VSWLCSTGPDVAGGPDHGRFAGADTVLTLNAELAATWYRFDLRRRSGELVWRHDCHRGHEGTLGTRHHLHIGPEEEHRIPAEPATLEHIATKIVATHVNLRR
jgi:hypothetical protein